MSLSSVAHRIRLLALAGAATILAACAAAPATENAAAERWPTQAAVEANQTAFSQEGVEALDARLRQAVEKGEVAGLVWVLAKDGKIAGFRIHGDQSYGGPPMTEDTIFRIRSMSKPVTGVALMQLYEKGLWKLDDPVTKYLPELAGLKVMTGEDPDNGDMILVDAERPATMRDLFTHTGGFGYGLGDRNPVDRMFIADHPMGKPDLDALVQRVAEIPLLAQPGERFSYSISIDLQGAIVERLSGMTFGTYLKANLFDPLGMTDTSFVLAEEDRSRLATVYTRNAQTGEMEVYPDPPLRDFFKSDHAESGGGGLASTTHDYVRFAQMLVNGGELDGNRVLKPETLELMMQNHLPDGMRGFGAGWGLGGQVQIESTERAPQPVGTFSWFGIDGTWFWADPVNDIVFVGMIQRRGGAGPGSIDLRGESPRLVYDALNP